jgi:hypothetical protein
LEESSIVSLSEKNFKVIGKGKKHYPKTYWKFERNRFEYKN